jgi:hypothetical protein
MTAVRLLLAGGCVVALGTVYAVTRPNAEATPEVGSAPVRVVEEPAYKAQRLGRAAKLPALAPAPAPPKPAPVQMEPVERRRSVPVEQTQHPPQPSEPYATRPAPVTPPPEPAPVYEAPPPTPQPPPPTPQPPPAPTQGPDAVTFDDSG